MSKEVSFIKKAGYQANWINNYKGDNFILNSLDILSFEISNVVIDEQ
ncbi:hypothetical protein NEH72_06915 [Turicibacter sp. 1E2]|nr:hypothetical protein [Turicibacter sp. 1E2]MCU7209574.1 hypothetical protein [Turicibacter sp. 1E2]